MEAAGATSLFFYVRGPLRFLQIPGDPLYLTWPMGDYEVSGSVSIV